MAQGSRRTIGELQEAVDLAVRVHGLATDPAARMLDLVSEVGELAKVVVEASGYRSSRFTPGPEWHEELGDVAFSLLALAGATSTPLDEAVDGAIDKIDQRIARTGSASSGGMPRPV